MYPLRQQKRLFLILLWIVAGLYVVVNTVIFNLSLPFTTIVILLPLFNISMIAVWFGLKTYYNKIKGNIETIDRANNPHVDVVTKYGSENAPTSYEPDLKLDALTFNIISKADSNAVTAEFGLSLNEYLQAGRIITFHHVDDYGLIVRVEVVRSEKHDKFIVADIALLK